MPAPGDHDQSAPRGQRPRIRWQRSRIRWRTGGLLGALAATAVLAPLCQDASAAPQVGGFSARPAHFDASNPATRAYFIRSVAPGHSFTDEVVVSNTSSHTLKLYVNAVDGLTGVTSGAVYANRQDPVRKDGRWVTPAAGEVTVAPKRRVLVAFHVQVPSSAMPGDHLAGLALQDATPVRSAGQFSVTEIVRAVVGIEVKVPGPEVRRLDLGAVTLRALPGTKIPSTVVVLTNGGTLLCKPKLTVTLMGNGVDRAVKRQLDTMLPGDRIPYPVPWPKPLQSGTYQATVQASGCGPSSEIGQSVTLASDLKGTTLVPVPQELPGTVTSSKMPIWELPVIAFAGVGLGILFARLVRMLLGFLRRRRRDDEDDDQPTMALPQGFGTPEAGDYHSLSRPGSAQPQDPAPPPTVR